MIVKKETHKKELEILKEDFEDLKTYFDELREILPVSICTVGSRGIVVDINKAAEALIGYKTLEIIGQSIEVFFYPKEDITILLKKIEEEGRIKTKETTLITSNNEKISVSVSVSLRKDSKGNPIGYFLTIINISKIKKYQKQLEIRAKELNKSRTALMNILEDIDDARKIAEEERDKTKAIITNFADGLLVVDKENKIILINPEGEKILGVSGGEINGIILKGITEFPVLNKLIKLLEIKESKDDLFRKELFLETPKKHSLEITTISITRDEETLIILHDISREKLIEKMKTEFVSLAAHQLRTPLSAIKWTLKMFLDGDLGKITEEQRDFIEKTYQSNERMIILINNLLDVTRIEEGKYLFKPTFTQIENVLQFVLNSLKEIIKRKKIKLDFEKPQKKLPKIKIDVDKMRLAINNLLDNAIKYTPVGGQITVSLRHNGKEIEFLVKDSGVGIPKDQQGRIFTKFFRGTNVVQIETDGTGLGLFIAKNIIETHGGKIWFESEENKGTTFYFTLPIKEEFQEFLKEF